MQYANMHDTDKKIVNAEYVRPVRAIDKGNIFIEALPLPRAKEQVIAETERGIPNFNREKEIRKPAWEQIVNTTQLRNIIVPLPMHCSLETSFYTQLVTSYSKRYIFSEKDAALEFRMNGKMYLTNGRLVGDDADSANTGGRLLGYSGCGKSLATKLALEHYPQVIMHKGSHGAVYIQVVYLVVNCPPNSNIHALYTNIAIALDRALGNVEPFYEKMLKNVNMTVGEAGRRIRKLIEQFAIGLIIFDEVQNISFSQGTDRSFESILELVNETKVAFDIIGTEDAGDKLLTNLRMARRMGAEINANAYCGSRPTFDRIIDFIFQYQWFRTPVVPTKEIKDAMYKYTRGIIDQIIGLYTWMQVDYILAPAKRKDRPIDGNYVREVSEKHFAGMAKILQRAEYDPGAELKRAEMMKNADEAIREMINRKKSEDELKDYETLISSHNDSTAVRDSVIEALQMTTVYAEQTIRNAFNAVSGTPQGQIALKAGDKKALAKLTTERLNQTGNKLKFGARKEQAKQPVTSFLDNNADDPLAG